MQTLRKRTSPCKYRNDPGRFFGDGVQFKAKLIGILEVGEARGDRMCQEALQDLKMAIRAAGEHKQRITIHVTIDGLRLRDEKTGDSLYHHPVHKISFIAQDMSDSRAFGYIFGSPDSGHRFFGIKTDKAASQVVLAMRDLFQVVFELKKKEIELARQQIQSHSIQEHHLSSQSSLKLSGDHNDLNGINAGNSFALLNNPGIGNTKKSTNLESKTSKSKEMTPESVADLVDLEQELSSIQRGITQMERITPSETLQPIMDSREKICREEDPFGDSFTNFPTYILPPPETDRSRNKSNKALDCIGNNVQGVGICSLLSTTSLVGSIPCSMRQEDENWSSGAQRSNDIFDTTNPNVQRSDTVSIPVSSDLVSTTVAILDSYMADVTNITDQQQVVLKPVKSDAFTDLDPLGTGRTRPYVDKKYFFQELKNPPKKVLKDLSSNNAIYSSGSICCSSSDVADGFLSKDTLFDDTNVRIPLEITSVLMSSAVPAATVNNQHHRQQTSFAISNVTNTNNSTHSTSVTQSLFSDFASTINTAATNICICTGTITTTELTNNSLISSAATTAVHVISSSTQSTTNSHLHHNTIGCSSPTCAGTDPVMLPRDTDPFSPTRKKSNPFQEGEIFIQLDPFQYELSYKTDVRVSGSITTEQSPDIFNGPLQVSLPPEDTLSPPMNVQWKNDVSQVRRQDDGAASSPDETFPQSISVSYSRSRPIPSIQLSSGPISSTSVFKQQTVDVISSISNKKMPHLFGQTRFAKRDSNNINMKRLQESDSLSENETAPDPPPRPDSVSYVEPPPLPPKKNFNEIVIRPCITTCDIVPETNKMSMLKYDAHCSSVSSNNAVPEIPLPSRRRGRSDCTYPGPARPHKPVYIDDGYLSPIIGRDVPPLLPPPTQNFPRGRTHRQPSLPKLQEIYENKADIQKQQETQQLHSFENVHIIPHITLSQLLTLGIDELALKLSVPSSKLSTMTLVELTSYLSEFIEKIKPNVKEVTQNTVEQKDIGSFQSLTLQDTYEQQSTFVAKFDDNFGDYSCIADHSTENSFIANFDYFNETPLVLPVLSNAGHTPAVPPADRYAVFREIIDQDLKYKDQKSTFLDNISPSNEVSKSASESDTNVKSESDSKLNVNFDDDDFLIKCVSEELPIVDNKIVQVVAQAKDRYAALRDIILVENLFEKKSFVSDVDKDLIREFSDDFNEDLDLKQIMDIRTYNANRVGIVDSCELPAEPSSSALTIEDEYEEDKYSRAESSLDSIDKDTDITLENQNQLPQDQYKQLSTPMKQIVVEKIQKIDSLEAANISNNNAVTLNIKQDNKFLAISGGSGFSISKDDLEIDELMQRAISNLSLDSREHISPVNSGNVGVVSCSASATRSSNQIIATQTSQSQFNDVSTSPILENSPMPLVVQQSHLQQKPAKLKSPILSQLSVISNFIDVASKQKSSLDLLSENTPGALYESSKESWATFEHSKPVLFATMNDSRSNSSILKQSASMHLPPALPSNTSQNDTAESPCSSDLRDDGWDKSADKSGKCWTKKERQHTSSSSRDVSPWDDESSSYQQHKRMQTAYSGRHGYYVRHARRINSCDEGYNYNEEFINRREHRKIKHDISRSRDNFDLDSSNWCQHHSHHTWSPQGVDLPAGGRARSFDRNSYDRTTFGTAIYDNRVMSTLSPLNFEPRSGYENRKYNREYTRPEYDFNKYEESPSTIDRYPDSFEKSKIGRRFDYQNVYNDRCLPLVYKARTDYMYERDRKSLDRESVELYKSLARRHRSFGSGDIYGGTVDSQDSFPDRLISGSENSRSLRKNMKLRTTGDIDYEPDSENDFQQCLRNEALDAHNLQRTNQFINNKSSDSAVLNSSQIRVRKSSGVSPWDGEESSPPNPKTWKRPSSVASLERRLAENRRIAGLGQSHFGSDGEKDRRFRKKLRMRLKEFPINAGMNTTATRFNNGIKSHSQDKYAYITYVNDGDIENDFAHEDYNDTPMDEDKFQRLNRCQQEIHQHINDGERRTNLFGMQKLHPGVCTDFDFDDYERTIAHGTDSGIPSGSNHSKKIADITKFSFDGGFESDFNHISPPSPQLGTMSSCNSTPIIIASTITTPMTQSSFRFSNDFSENEQLQPLTQNPTSTNTLQQFDNDTTCSIPRTTLTTTQKLRFDDNVKISQFEGMSKVQIDFEKQGRCQVEATKIIANTASKKYNLRNSKFQQRQELLKKSESINIFAKKTDDPFEDDEFFQMSTETKTDVDNDVSTTTINNTNNNENAEFQWDVQRNFAKFDDNM